MINLHFTLNVNRNFDILRDDEYEVVREVAYHPLLDVLENLELKTTLFLTGRTIDTMSQEDPRFIERIQDLVKKDIVAVGNHTYGHPIMPLIEMEDAEKQIEFSQVAEKEFFGSTATAFYPPEFCTDPTLPYVMNRNNLTWMLLHNSNYLGAYGHAFEDMFKIGIVRGIKDSETQALTVYGDAEEWIRSQIHGVFEGAITPAEFFTGLIEKVKRETDSLDFNPLLCLYTDSESPYFNYDTTNPSPVAHFQKAMELILASPEIRSVSASEVIEDSSIPRVDLNLKMRATYKPFDLWIIGSEKLDRLIDQARTHVYEAQKKYPADARINAMWKYFLLSQTSDARSNLSERRMETRKVGRQMRHGNLERTLQAYDNAIKAKELAMEILHE